MVALRSSGISGRDLERQPTPICFRSLTVEHTLESRPSLYTHVYHSASDEQLASTVCEYLPSCHIYLFSVFSGRDIFDFWDHITGRHRFHPSWPSFYSIFGYNVSSGDLIYMARPQGTCVVLGCCYESFVEWIGRSNSSTVGCARPQAESLFVRIGARPSVCSKVRTTTKDEQ